jgi:hypothetical protein
MNSTCAFTICAKNYIGLAKTLEQSLREHNPTVDFYVFVADELDDETSRLAGDSVLSARDHVGIPGTEWREMSFKYDIVEFCTAIKPSCMEHLLEAGYEQVMYLDPDILVFDSLTPVLDALRQYMVVVTPHQVDVNNDIPRRGGIYNLGFIAVRNAPSVRRMLTWWKHRLRNNCSVDPMIGQFTDQKWMDHLPVVLQNGELFVARHPGLNYAPWNFDERRLIGREGKYFVAFKNPAFGEEAPLVFLHFSAFKYKEIARGNYNHKGIPMADREPELFRLIQIYGERLNASGFLQFLDLPYTYDRFSNGSSIQYIHRRIFKRLREEGWLDGDPFDSTGALFEVLSRNRLVASQGFNPERIREKDVSHADRKLRMIDMLFSLIVRAIGHARFSLLARFMIRYLHLNNRARLLGREFRALRVQTF